ncbi:nitroreductase [Virgibacillus halodenitrificans]|uniref:nitroreductase n=1 Tax=Virgibacillus halodenitrificans TaxID=1482 RepID=UPI0024C0B3FB|nr:nitroreductase [Virgibacillus halodenitrificans]WHX25129.1 nitroreductase [Virgibacillus halodenitrificans]
MERSNILLQRHSVRDFTDKEINIDLLKQIIFEAQRAPSYENSQPWKAYIATGKTLESIRKVHAEKVANRQKSWTEVTPPLGWKEHPKNNVANYMKETENLIGENGIQDLVAQNAVLFNAPAIIYITMPKDSSHYSAYDIGAFGYGILLSAYHHGLGTVPAYEIIRYPEEIRDHFDISDEESILMGIAIGYPTEGKPLSTLVMSRENLDNILQIKE